MDIEPYAADGHPAYLEVDLPELIRLKLSYESTIECLLDELPDVNWNSRVESHQYFLEEHNLCLLSFNLSDLKEIIYDFEDYLNSDGEYHNDPERALETLTTLIEIKKLQACLRNYINNILKWNEGGIYPLRMVDGKWKFQNKQEICYDPNITNCIIATNLRNPPWGKTKREE
jgi:hypothetical protein